MKRIIPLIFLVGCGQPNGLLKAPIITVPVKCTVELTPSGDLLSKCDGRDIKLTNGQDGFNSVFNQSIADRSVCPASGVVITVGQDLNRNGVLDLTEVKSAAVICNGNNGVNGSNGTNGTNAAPTPLTPVALIYPCGINSAPYKEVLLRLENGSLLASFSDNVNGYNTRLAIIPDGSYQDTDPSSCNFSITTVGKLRSISWSGGGQSWTIE